MGIAVTGIDGFQMGRVNHFWRATVPLRGSAIQQKFATTEASCISFTPKHTSCSLSTATKRTWLWQQCRVPAWGRKMPRKASSPSGKRYFSYPQARKGTICHTLTPTTHRTSKFSVLVFTSHFWRRQQKMNATSFVAVSKNEMWRTNRIHSLLQTYPQPWSSENLLRCGWCTADWAQWRYTSWVESTNAILLSKISPSLK